MKFYGYYYPQYGGYYITGTVIYTSHSSKIVFLIDTGCTITTMNFLEALKMGLTQNTLPPFNNPMTIADGRTVQTSKIQNVGITFDFFDYLILERLPEIRINPSAVTSHNLLGLDVLRRYTLRYQKDKVILER